MSHLGLSFLSRHIVTLDFPNNRIYLKKGKGFKKDDETDMSGLHLLRISNQTVVYSVDEGSPAQKAGIRANDIILKVGDKDANTYDILELRRLLRSGVKHKILMTIKQNDDVKDVSFLLKKKI
jgi:C-terminal processing protease CtpA/Prc